MVDDLVHITACAITPDQLVPYVSSVSGLQSTQLGNFVIHQGQGHGVLIGYSLSGKNELDALNAAVAQAITWKHLEHLTVIAPERPLLAPKDAIIKKDSYWILSLPMKSKAQKLRNMLSRAHKEVKVEKQTGNNCWSKAHANLAKQLCKKKSLNLEAGTEYIFNHLNAYLEKSPDTILFSAYSTEGILQGCAVGDYSALETAFYMFAFRANNAVPGTADVLLEAVIDEATDRGYGKINLGLGIDDGIRFFKKKWGALPVLPCFETSWKINSKQPGWLKRLFG